MVDDPFLGAAPLSRTLARDLLAVEDVPVLRAALLDDADGRSAWSALRALGDDLKTIVGARPDALKSILPVLFAAADRLAVPLSPIDATYLRTARLREERRIAAYEAIERQVVAAIEEADIEPLVLGGSGLSARFYAARGERHSHDIHLLFPAAVSRARALAALLAARLPLESVSSTAGANIVRLRHESGMYVLLQTSLFSDPFFGPPASALFDRRERVDLGAIEITAPCSVDAMLFVCGRAALEPFSASPMWIADAMAICRRFSAADWADLAERGIAGHLAAVLVAGLGVLAREFDLIVPAETTGRLARAARSDLVAVDRLLFDIRTRDNCGPVDLLRRLAPGSDRWTGARRLIAPSRDYLAWAHNGRTGIDLYLTRPYRALRRGWRVMTRR